MVIKPMIRNNLCMNAHPVGARLQVQNYIDYVKGQKPVAEGPKKVLVVGSSTGYGLASRIVAAFGSGACTIGVALERPATAKRPATIGWYNTEYMQEKAREAGLVAEQIYGDAFSHELKQQTIAKIKELFGKVDLIVYSLASPVRTDPDSGEMYRSQLKPLGAPYTAKSVDAMSGAIGETTIEPAGDGDVEQTVKVMGGDDWKLWTKALLEAGVVEEGTTTVAYSYIGPDLTRPIYREGTIGKAKEDLEKSAHELNAHMKDAVGGSAFVSVNKALVTRSSAVIPMVPLYMAILFRVMKAKGIHEGVIEQMYRLFSDRLYKGGPVPTDEAGMIRMDDWEMRDDIQKEVEEIWPSITSENIEKETDMAGYRSDFLQLHGFGFDEVDYDADVEI